jgi:hypothetical protein
LAGLALSGLKLSSRGKAPKRQMLRGFLEREVHEMGAFFWIITVSCTTAPILVPVVVWVHSLL